MTALTIVFGWLALAFAAAAALLLAVTTWQARELRAKGRRNCDLNEALRLANDTVHHLKAENKVIRDENVRHLEQRVFGTPT